MAFEFITRGLKAQEEINKITREYKKVHIVFECEGIVIASRPVSHMQNTTAVVSFVKGLARQKGITIDSITMRISNQ